MRIPHKLAHSLALITFLLTLPFLVADATAQVPCATPPAQPEGKNNYLETGHYSEIGPYLP